MKRTQNPFIYQGYEGPDFFCDRVVETEKLCSSLYNGRNVTLISPRRMGKTGLIKNTFHQIEHEKKDAICLYVDIFSTKNQIDFVRMLGTSIVDRVFSKGEQFKKQALEFFSAWRPVFSMDPLTGVPTVSVSIEPSQSEMTLKSMFEYLESLQKEVFIAIDEFQQIAEYPEAGTEALLRSHIQFVHNAHFIFSGSKSHLIAEMFTSPQRPFYQSTDIMSLNPLHEEIYYDFANRFFEKRGGRLERAVFSELYRRFEGYTWYIQSILNRLYERHHSVTELSQMTDAILSVLSDKAPLYENLLPFLTENQFVLLKAIASEDKVAQPTSKDFIQKYRLSTPSSVKSSLTVLLNKELVYRLLDGYIIYDRFFNLWLQRTML